MAKHARLSPSSRHRWGACPASVRECAKYPEGSRTNPSAIDGTHSHTLLERSLTSMFHPSFAVGQEWSDHDGTFVIDEERAERVALAYEYVKKTVESNGYVNRVDCEIAVDPYNLLGRDDMFGSVDVAIVNSHSIEIIDYKDGWTPVAAKNNPQMQQYAWGLLSGMMKEGDAFPVAEIKMTIIQPRLRLSGRSGIDSHTMTIAEFAVTYPLIMRQAEATDDPDAPFVPGEVQCKYCAHAGNCSAMFEHTMAKAGIKFDDLSESAAKVEPKSMTDEHLISVLEAAPLLRQIIENAEEEALKRMTNGEQLPGFKVVRGRGQRAWNDDPVAIEQVLRSVKIPKSEIYRQVMVSPAQVEKLKWKNRAGEEVSLNKKQLEKVLAKASRSDGKLTVVSAADKRPAVEFQKVEGMFSETGAELPDWLK